MFKNNKKTMKTIVFSLGLAAMTLTANHLNAQNDGSRGLFGMGKSSADYEYSYSNRGLINVDINSNTGGGITNDDFGAPLGSGIAILLAAGAGYAVVRRKRSRRNTTLLLACVMLLGFTQCKKEQIVPQSEGNGGEESGVRITLNVNKDNNKGSKAEVDPPHVSFVENDKILVAHDGKYVGTLTYTEYETGKFRFEGNIDATVANPRQKLYFYFLGNKQNDASLTAGTTTSCTVDISDQTSYPTLPVISFSASKEDYEGAGSYSANLHNKASLIKFNVTTPSNSPICIKGMNNLVTVNFANRADNDGFSYGKVDENGVIKIKGGKGTNVEKWVVVLQQDALPKGDEGTAYLGDNSFVGVRPAIPEITMNQYIDDDRTLILSGKFTINNNGDQVYFALGNLRYASEKWSCFDNQYEYYTSYSADAWDKFGWSTENTTYGMSTSTSKLTYYGSFVDWGATICSGWRTLTGAHGEWEFLSTRESGSTVNGIPNANYTHATINTDDTGVKGVILFPDGITILNNAVTSWGNINNYTQWNYCTKCTSSQWLALEAKGCVFLPAAGKRDGETVSSVDSYVCYWSATNSSDHPTEMAYRIWLYNYGSAFYNEDYRYYGYSVRLVYPVQ